MNRFAKTLWLLARRTVQEYSADNCSHMSAAISYYVLFSIIPLAIFLISLFGIVVRDTELQEDVSSEIVDFLDVEEGTPTFELERDAVEDITIRYGAAGLSDIRDELKSLNEESRRQEDAEQLAMRIETRDSLTIVGFTLRSDEITVRSDNVVIDTIRGVSEVSGALTLVGLAGMAWSSSAMFGAIRKSLNIAWDTDVHRPIVQQKLIDLGMVLGLGVLLALSIGGTTALRTIRTLSDDALGPLSTGTGFFWSVLPFFLPAVFSFVVFLLMYQFVPNVKTRFRDVWAGALLAGVLFEILKNGFALYVANFNSFAGAYGALGGILLFLFFTYLTSNILLIGAELAAEYPRVMRGDYAEPERPAKESRSLQQTVRRVLRGLFVHHPDEPPETERHTDAGAKR